MAQRTTSARVAGKLARLRHALLVGLEVFALKPSPASMGRERRSGRVNCAGAAATGGGHRRVGGAALAELIALPPAQSPSEARHCGRHCAGGSLVCAGTEKGSAA
eukprot:CAMPEP_0119416936 /NCGR_PEP_ID=MMETSP1335-20130426/14467_1 /TAXON_ID=259385 /ORGANISM="Chrysoculter rhomboideus, Strain RCC1486" /LENGTH=104 /DNA_ID=CAMNT_0007442083 /DNA_START=192 /DNA_END=506 /DNA_ORIENTATION=+